MSWDYCQPSACYLGHAEATHLNTEGKEVEKSNFIGIKIEAMEYLYNHDSILRFFVVHIVLYGPDAHFASPREVLNPIYLIPSIVVKLLFQLFYDFPIQNLLSGDH